MGIDAEMLIRGVPAKIVDDEWLKSLSWRMVEAIGEKHFFITDGLVWSEYEKANKAWHDAFNAHPVYPEWNALYEKPKNAGIFWSPGADAEARRGALHAQIFADIGKAPDQQRLAIERTLTRYRDEGDAAPGSEYHEDSEVPVKARPGECLLQVSLYGRYYGPGYERGDILTYCAIAEWLELNIPGCEVWYGGDSSGVCVERFDELKRRELRTHLFTPKGRDYFKGMWSMHSDEGYGTPAACSLCPGGKYCGSRFGVGKDFASYHCAGCGISEETRDGGKTWVEKKND